MNCLNSVQLSLLTSYYCFGLACWRLYRPVSCDQSVLHFNLDLYRGVIHYIVYPLCFESKNKRIERISVLS